MISQDMFRPFVSHEIKDTAKHMNNTYYHLDGEGELPHLETLLKIEELEGIQWIPGEGAPQKKDWSEVYSKIAKAGKKI